VATTQREHSLRLATLETRVDEGFHETRARFRSVDEQLAEIKDLIIGGRSGG
jgi:hypothetical protein